MDISNNATILPQNIKIGATNSLRADSGINSPSRSSIRSPSRQTDIHSDEKQPQPSELFNFPYEEVEMAKWNKDNVEAYEEAVDHFMEEFQHILPPSGSSRHEWIAPSNKSNLSSRLITIQKCQTPAPNGILLPAKDDANPPISPDIIHSLEDKNYSSIPESPIHISNETSPKSFSPFVDANSDNLMQFSDEMNRSPLNPKFPTQPSKMKTSNDEISPNTTLNDVLESTFSGVQTSSSIIFPSNNYSEPQPVQPISESSPTQSCVQPFDAMNNNFFEFPSQQSAPIFENYSNQPAFFNSLSMVSQAAMINSAGTQALNYSLPMASPFGPPPGMYNPTMGLPGISPQFMPNFMQQQGYPGMMSVAPMSIYGMPPPAAFSMTGGLSQCQTGYPASQISRIMPSMFTERSYYQQSNSQSSHATSKEEEVWVENLAAEGRVYYYNIRTRETRWEPPEGVKIVHQGEIGKEKPKTGPAKIPVQASSRFKAETVMASITKPAEVIAWNEYRSPDGQPYYHNTSTGETTWQKPKILIEWEIVANSLSNSLKVNQEATPATNHGYEQGVANPMYNYNQMLTSRRPGLVSNFDTSTSKTENFNRMDENVTDRDYSRPVSSTPISGTPWCVVWTGDNRVFFFNPSIKASVWETPLELKGRSDVEDLIAHPPSETKIDENEVSSAPENPLNTDLSNPDVNEIEKKKMKLDPIVESIPPEVNNKTPGDQSPKAETLATVASPKLTEVVEEKKKTHRDKIPTGKEAAKEAIERANKERAVLPLNVCIGQFKEMLIEKQVSVFSTWEKELHKIVFDPRYLLLSSKERKQTFEAFVKERADDERREKKNKLKERRDAYISLLSEASLSPKSSFSDFSTKYSKDDRFRAVEKTRDREALFLDFLVDLRRKEKEKRDVKEVIKYDFFNLLKEQKNLSRHSHWSSIKKNIASDDRYEAVESSVQREDWFREYIKKLEGEATREDSETRKEREKRDRQEASIREREKEVKETRSQVTNECDRVRVNCQRSKAETTFQTLLVDLIKDDSLSWKHAKKFLRKDDRWDSVADILARSDRETLFKAHIAHLSKKINNTFYKFLSECKLIDFTTKWKEVKKFMQGDSHFDKFLVNEKKWESEFYSWLEERESNAKSNFMELLKEKSVAISKTKRRPIEGDEDADAAILDVIMKNLKDEKRFKALDSIHNKRLVLLEEFLKELSRSN